MAGGKESHGEMGDHKFFVTCSAQHMTLATENRSLPERCDYYVYEPETLRIQTTLQFILYQHAGGSLSLSLYFSPPPACRLSLFQAHHTLNVTLQQLEIPQYMLRQPPFFQVLHQSQMMQSSISLVTHSTWVTHGRHAAVSERRKHPTNGPANFAEWRALSG